MVSTRMMKRFLPFLIGAGLLTLIAVLLLTSNTSDSSRSSIMRSRRNQYAQSWRTRTGSLVAAEQCSALHLCERDEARTGMKWCCGMAAW